MFIAVYGFSVFLTFGFSFFTKNTNGFSDLISDAVFGSFQFDQLGYRFHFDPSGNYAPPLISLNANVIERTV